MSLSDQQRRTLRMVSDDVRASADAMDLAGDPDAVAQAERDWLDRSENARPRLDPMRDDGRDGVPHGLGWLVLGVLIGTALYAVFKAVWAWL